LKATRATRTIAVVALASALAGFGLAASAHASTAATMRASLAPNRLGASTAVSLAFGFTGGEEGVPAPLSAMALRLPAGLRLQLGGIAVCAPSRLRSRGAAGCPRDAILGRGHAQLEVHAGSLTVPEESSIAVFRGPSLAGRPTLEIYSHGESPLDESSTAIAVLRSERPPYGSRLTISLPPIPTLVFEPDASFSSLSLMIGKAALEPQRHGAGAVLAPRRCPAGGFPFAAGFTFADRSMASALAHVACP
jgi:hypothetical protein